jgi:uncharacterized protein YcfJ
MENNLMFNKLKNTSVALAPLVLVTALAAPTTTMAEQPSKVRVVDYNKTIVTSVPSTQEVCENVKVPIYSTMQVQGDAGGGALLGMIIGGLLGKGVTGDDGGAAAGAVLGGVIGADKNQSRTEQRIVGYENERQCGTRTTYVNQERDVYSHSIIHFRSGGKEYALRFQR